MKKTILIFIAVFIFAFAVMPRSAGEHGYPEYTSGKKMENARPIKNLYNFTESPRNSQAGKLMRIGAFADRMIMWEGIGAVDPARRINVAVIDTWVDVSHPFLAGCIDVPSGYPKSPDSADDSEHGTHVAGIIANSASPFVTVVPFTIGFMSESDSSTTTAALIRVLKSAIDYDGIDIINISLAFKAKEKDIDAIRPFILEALDKGILIVVAAGNGESNASVTPLDTKTVIPACFGTLPGVVTVSSANLDGKVPAGYNYGEAITLCAFGQDVTSAVPGSKIAEGSGSSMAAAYISAAAALLKFENPGLTPEQLENNLTAMTEKPSPAQAASNRYGAGIFKFPEYIGEKPYITMSSDKFRPDDFVTNIEIAEMLYNLLADPDTEYSSGIIFDDANYENKLTANILNFVSGSGYMAGSGNGESRLFKGQSNVTRGEIAAVISGINGYEKSYYGVEVYPLYDDTDGHWARSYIYLVTVNGAMTGIGDRLFAPDRFVTRAEIAEIFNWVFRRSPYPLSNLQFADVPAGHWAYSYIMNAAVPEHH